MIESWVVYGTRKLRRYQLLEEKKGARTKPDITEDALDGQFPASFSQRMMVSIVASPFDVCGLNARVPSCYVMSSDVCSR